MKHKIKSKRNTKDFSCQVLTRCFVLVQSEITSRQVELHVKLRGFFFFFWCCLWYSSQNLADLSINTSRIKCKELDTPQRETECFAEGGKRKVS